VWPDPLLELDDDDELSALDIARAMILDIESMSRPPKDGKSSIMLQPGSTSDILSRWLEKHLDHPYPNPDQTQYLSEITRLKMSEVRR
jgi:hypothetical protein